MLTFVVFFTFPVLSCIAMFKKNLLIVVQFLLRTLLLCFVLWGILEMVAAVVLLNSTPLAPLDKEEKQQPLMPASPDTLWKLEPNSHFSADGIDYFINSQGFRGSIITLAAPQRILFLGDSSTFGFGVKEDQTFAHLTANCMGLQPVNAGVAGYSSMQLVEHFKIMAPKIKPNWVVVALPWSDLMRTHVPDSEAILRARRSHSIRRLIEWPTGRWSFVVRWLKRQLTIRLRAQPKPINSEAVLLGKDQGSHRRVSPSELGQHLNLLYRLTHKIEARLVILFLPTNHSRTHPIWDIIRFYRHPAIDLAQKEKLILLDMDKHYQSLQENDLSQHFVDSVHPSPKTHKDIAERLCQEMSLRMAE